MEVFFFQAAPTRGGTLQIGSTGGTLDVPMRLPPQRFKGEHPGHPYAAPSTGGPRIAAPPTPPVAHSGAAGLRGVGWDADGSVRPKKTIDPFAPGAS